MPLVPRGAQALSFVLARSRQHCAITALAARAAASRRRPGSRAAGGAALRVQAGDKANQGAARYIGKFLAPKAHQSARLSATNQGPATLSRSLDADDLVSTGRYFRAERSTKCFVRHP